MVIRVKKLESFDNRYADTRMMVYCKVRLILCKSIRKRD